MTCRKTSERVPDIDVHEEKMYRSSLFAKAKESMALETPDGIINSFTCRPSLPDVRSYVNRK